VWSRAPAYQECIPKNFQNPVIKILYGFIGFLLQVLEAGTQGASRKIGSIGCQKFGLYLCPIAFVKIRDIFKRVGPRNGPIPQA
jgi:hypothetical protein